MTTRLGGTGVQTMSSAGTVVAPQEQIRDTLGRAKSSLVVVQNPSLDGYLGIMMAAHVMVIDAHYGANGDNEAPKAFSEVYAISAVRGAGYGIRQIVYYNVAKTGVQGENPSLHVVLTESEGRYEVGSELPHEVCEITNIEFGGFKDAIDRGDLGAVVDGMVGLLGKRLSYFQ